MAARCWRLCKVTTTMVGGPGSRQPVWRLPGPMPLAQFANAPPRPCHRVMWLRSGMVRRPASDTRRRHECGIFATCPCA
jgi:hypothetical protein